MQLCYDLCTVNRIFKVCNSMSFLTDRLLKPPLLQSLLLPLASRVISDWLSISVDQCAFYFHMNVDMQCALLQCDCFCSASSLGSTSRWWPVSPVCPCLLWSMVPLYKCTPSGSLSAPLMMGFQVVSSHGLLWALLLWTVMYKCSCENKTDKMSMLVYI